MVFGKNNLTLEQIEKNIVYLKTAIDERKSNTRNGKLILQKSLTQS